PGFRQLILFPALLVVGCNQSVPPAVKNADTYRSAVQQKPNRTLPVLSGTAMNGTIAQGVVTAYTATAKGSYFELDPKPVARPVRTGSDGRFRIQLPPGVSAPLILHLTTDT